MPRTVFTRHIGWLAAALLLTPRIASAGDSELAAALVKLRGQVESLAETLRLAQDQGRARLRSLAQQRGDLELTLQRKRLRLRQLRGEIARLKAKNEKQTKSSESLKPVVSQAAASLKGYIDNGIPFRLKERKAQLDKILRQMKEGVLTAEQAAARLWSTYADELRITQESGLYRQPLMIGGTRVLAEVVRIGMVMMFYRAPDGTVGAVIRNGDKSTLRPYVGQQKATMAKRKQVASLFDNFEKRVRTGPFTLPSVLTASQLAGGQP